MPTLSLMVAPRHKSYAIMSAMACQITSVSIVYSNVCSGADERKHRSTASLAFVRRIHRWPVNSPHKGPVTRKMFPFHDVIMGCHYEWHKKTVVLYLKTSTHAAIFFFNYVRIGMVNPALLTTSSINCVLEGHSSWWCPQMETFSALPALCAGNSPVTDEFPSQRPVTRSFDVFFDLCLNKRLSKQSRGRWFETPSHWLWNYCNVLYMSQTQIDANSSKSGLYLVQCYYLEPLSSLRSSVL